MKKTFLILALTLISATAVAQPSPPVPTISGLVHLERIGDRSLVGGQWAGTKGQSRRLEGIQMRLGNARGAVKIEYLCHLQGLGDVGPVAEGAFCGTRGQSRRLEAIQIRLTGPAARFFTVRYQCHLQEIGDVGPVADYVTCGTRGQSRRLEAIRVWIERR
jgi:uncharacterized protein YjdB